MPDIVGSSLSLNILPKISVFGIGGAGVNAVNNMILSQLDFDAVKFVVANTDCQSLVDSPSEIKIQLGAECTRGLGTGSNPEIGRQSAEESIERIKKELYGTDMLFIATGMGGGTGTGASPVVAKIAKEMEILTVAIAIKPFDFQGKKKMEIANKGIAELENIVDTLIVIENQKLMDLNDLSIAENYALADSILRQAIYCIVSILVKKGYINCDFADVRTILKSMGRAVIGYGEDVDPIIATDTATHNPILENSSIYGAKNILINITGGTNIKPKDIQCVIERVKDEAKINEDDEPNIIFGNAFDNDMGNKIRVSIIAAGVESEKKELNESNKIEQTQTYSINNTDNLNKISVEKDNDNLNLNSKIEAPVFNKPIDEDDLENDESFNLQTEDITGIQEVKKDDSEIFQGSFFQQVEEKKKNNLNSNKNLNKQSKVINNDLKSKEQFNDAKNDHSSFELNKNVSLFDGNSQPKKKGLISKIISSIGPAPFVANGDISDVFGKNESEKETIYSVSAYKRKFG